MGETKAMPIKKDSSKKGEKENPTAKKGKNMEKKNPTAKKGKNAGKEMIKGQTIKSVAEKTMLGGMKVAVKVNSPTPKKSEKGEKLSPTKKSSKGEKKKKKKVSSKSKKSK